MTNDEERAGRGEHCGPGGRTVKLSMIYGQFKVMRIFEGIGIFADVMTRC